MSAFKVTKKFLSKKIQQTSTWYRKLVVKTKTGKNRDGAGHQSKVDVVVSRPVLNTNLFVLNLIVNTQCVCTTPACVVHSDPSSYTEIPLMILDPVKVG